MVEENDGALELVKAAGKFVESEKLNIFREFEKTKSLRYKFGKLFEKVKTALRL